jgi:hypothetical protein
MSGLGGIYRPHGCIVFIMATLTKSGQIIRSAIHRVWSVYMSDCQNYNNVPFLAVMSIVIIGLAAGVGVTSRRHGAIVNGMKIAAFIPDSNRVIDYFAPFALCADTRVVFVTARPQ